MESAKERPKQQWATMHTIGKWFRRKKKKKKKRREKRLKAKHNRLLQVH